jgi:hypothetical protein
MTPQKHNELEQLVSRAVRDLPPRSAPRSLETRVQAELARRAALPWWRKSFSYWPVAAQVVMGVVCIAAAKFVLTAVMWLNAGLAMADLKGAFAPERRWFEIITGFARTVGETASVLVGSIPTLWLYGGVAIIVALYVALFGLGAAAYRTLYANS